jgi:hypothetical protein
MGQRGGPHRAELLIHPLPEVGYPHSARVGALLRVSCWGAHPGRPERTVLHRRTAGDPFRLARRSSRTRPLVVAAAGSLIRYSLESGVGRMGCPAGSLPGQGGLRSSLVVAQVGGLRTEDALDLGCRVAVGKLTTRSVQPGNDRCADTAGRCVRSLARNSTWSVKMLSPSRPRPLTPNSFLIEEARVDRGGEHARGPDGVDGAQRPVALPGRLRRANSVRAPSG